MLTRLGYNLSQPLCRVAGLWIIDFTTPTGTFMKPRNNPNCYFMFSVSLTKESLLTG